MRTTITTRKKILDAFNAGNDIQKIMSDMNLSYFQVYNVVTRRVKTSYSRRSDKGSSRRIEFPSKTLEEFNSPEEYLRYQLYESLKQLNTKSIPTIERMRILRYSARIEKDIKSWQLENILKRPDAVIIARIMRRFQPSLTDDQIIQIYKEEIEKIAREPR